MEIGGNQFHNHPVYLKPQFCHDHEQVKLAKSITVPGYQSYVCKLTVKSKQSILDIDGVLPTSH